MVPGAHVLARQTLRPFPELVTALERATGVVGTNQGWMVTTKLLEIVVEWSLSRRPRPREADAVGEVRRHIDALRGLEKLRNDGVHLMRGVSLRDIDGALPAASTNFTKHVDAVCATLRTLFDARLRRAPSAVSPAAGTDLYLEINEEILERFRAFMPRKTLVAPRTA